jgi:hypothetical protein
MGELSELQPWNRIGLPSEERLWPLSANGFVSAAAADERVPVRFPIPARHRP